MMRIFESILRTRGISRLQMNESNLVYSSANEIFRLIYMDSFDRRNQ